MTCTHGTSHVTPLPVDFTDLDELREYLGLPDTPQGRAIVAAVIACERKGRR